jgi:ubiquitin-conjugating enzyme E2 J2
MIFLNFPTPSNPRSNRTSTQNTKHKSANNMIAQNRLQKEFRQLVKDPLPNIRAHPDSEDTLLWHFVLLGDGGVYEGGQYYGQIIFPPEYPNSPPDMKMLTPSGRFVADKRLCMTMTSYHKDQWNPLWSVSSLLLGLQSFFYEESPNSIGSMQSSDDKRKILAQESVSFNTNNTKIADVFRSLFPDLACVVGKKRERDTEDEVDNYYINYHNKKKANRQQHEHQADNSVGRNVEKQIEVIEILD